MSRWYVVSLLSMALACGDDDAPGFDAGPDAERDAAPSDAGRDAAPSDAGFDAGDPDDASTDGGADAAVDAGDAPCEGPPGLYAEGSCDELAPGVRPFRPRFELFSDGADKERFVYLPPGAQIDTSDPDRWGLPTGTRLYKTFAAEGRRLETRLLEKVGEARGTASWRMVSFAWSEDQRSVREVGAFGEQNVLGTEHDIPTRAECIRCHSIAQDDAADGFTALQLHHDGEGVTLVTLLDEGWLSEALDPADVVVPGDDLAVEALGYLHANCGSCHGGPTPEHGLDLWIPIGVTSVVETPSWITAVCSCSVWSGTTAEGDPVNLRVAPGDPAHSVFTLRMGSRVPTDQMPPIGTERVDVEGLALVSAWIASLAADANGCPHGCPFP